MRNYCSYLQLLTKMMASRNTTPFMTLFLTCPRRQAIVCFKTAGIRLENNGIDKIQVTVIINENIAVNSIKDVVLIVGVISTIVLRMEAKTDKFVVNLLFCGQSVLPVGQICKPLFPQELQSPQGLAARKRMRLPIFHFRSHFGIHLLVVVGQYDLHSLLF